MPKGKWNVKDMTDPELYEFISGWKVNTEGYITGTEELKRRNEAPANKRAWFAIGISILALIISFLSFLSKSESAEGFELRWCPSESKDCNLTEGLFVKGGEFRKLSECNNTIKHLKYNKNHAKGECFEIQK